MSELRSYPEYKDSGVEWIGEIPREWSHAKIKWLTSVKRGASPRPIDNPAYFAEEGEYSWVRISDVTQSNMYLKGTDQKLSELGSSLSVKLDPGNLFLSIAGSVGKPIINDIRCCIHDGFVYFPEYKGDVRYLFYIFASGKPYKGLGKLGTQLNLNTETVGSIVIPILSHAKQKKIADFLDTTTAQIDSLIADKERLIKLLEEKRQAVITETVTKGLDPNVKMKDSGVEWIGEIPEHWGVAKLKYLSNDKLTYGANESALDNNKGDFRYIRITDIDDEGNLREETYKTLPKEVAKRYPVIKGDLLFARSGATVGKTYIHETTEIACYAGYLIRYRADAEKLNSKLLYFYTKSSLYNEWIKENLIQATIENISADKYANLHIPLPNLNEQNEIVDYLNVNFQAHKSIIWELREQITKLKEYRESLIYEAVTGKIDLRDYHAEVLEEVEV